MPKRRPVLSRKPASVQAPFRDARNGARSGAKRLAIRLVYGFLFSVFHSVGRTIQGDIDRGSHGAKFGLSVRSRVSLAGSGVGVGWVLGGRTPGKPTAWSLSDPPVIVGQEPQFLGKSRHTRRSLLPLWIVREPTRPVGSRHELGPVPSHPPTMRASPTGDSLAPPHRESASQCRFTPNREEESVIVCRSGP